MADPDQGQELQHQPVGRRRSCALALVAADAGPLPAKGVGSREAQPAHEVRQEIFEEDDHIATESRAAWDLYVYFTCYIYMQEGTRKRRKRRGEERREAGGGHDSREIKTKARKGAGEILREILSSRIRTKSGGACSIGTRKGVSGSGSPRDRNGVENGGRKDATFLRPPW